MNNKYSNFLTILLVVVIIAIVGLLGFLGYDFYKKYYVSKETSEFMEQYDKENSEKNKDNNTDNSNVTSPLDSIESANLTSSGTKKKPQYKGFNVLGKIEIPKIKLEYPILETVTKKSLETSVAALYGPGPNEAGNTVIVGHNYRNGLFFSNNKKLANGDPIFITDNSGTKLQYTIYNIYQTTPEDATYMSRDTQGAKEISLSTCTDDGKERLIIWAKANS